ncbi:uncharacterized protein C8A04DRAFT_14151 [Dichotomopilus funicola]|uniref:Zn(2)-C6 fungal-type domain-containing protein n=1 Tax=Dichotomopilus funicola TaxID=1934379 RepID=A0AAN6ZK34_9PEZI|nr:hypothetical protein C8A04DRAFT_14151 [Dichotomopilus funicola]
MTTPTALTSAGGKRRSRSEGESDRASSVQPSSPGGSSSRSSAKQQIRHRASVACASCRERRIRCVVSEGESECTQCRRTGATCIIKDDDERRRPISKAYMSSLSTRISLLEGMLKDRGVVPPPAIHPPKTRQEAQARQHEDQSQDGHHYQHQQTNHEPFVSLEPLLSPGTKATPPMFHHPPTPPGSGDEDALTAEPDYATGISTTEPTNFTALIDPVLLQEPPEPQPTPKQAPPPQETSIRHILASRGSLITDPSTHQTRYFGPTANSHVYAPPLPSHSTLIPTQPDPASQQHTRRAEQLLYSLPPSIHDHLLGRFWEYYNAWQQVVHQTAFETGRATRDGRFYSVFLHLTMLAVGFRFADWEREDVKRLAVDGRESVMHRVARGLVLGELGRLGGLEGGTQMGSVPGVQGLLMLAAAECGIGRDAAGWMYCGMAGRLAFDIGLHVSCATVPGMSELEKQTRRQAMTACVMLDRKWALFLGRPTAIKTHDIAHDVLPRAGYHPGLGIPTTTSRVTDIHRHLFELLDLAGKVADFQNTTYGAAHEFPTKDLEDRAYLRFVALERLFHTWYRRLPEYLTWTPTNVESAPVGFFMLHQHFHECMVLLHRPWAKYGPLSLDGYSSTSAARYPSPESPSNQTHGHKGPTGMNDLPPWMTTAFSPQPQPDNRASLSRSMCTQHAIRIVRVFAHYRQRFDGRRVVLCAVQHAGTAALALMAALAHKSAELDHHSNLRYLQVLSTAIYDLSHLYAPGARMYQLLKRMLVEIREEMAKNGGWGIGALVGGRYQSSRPGYWPPGNENENENSLRGQVDRLEIIQEEEPEYARTHKRRRLSSLSSAGVATISPSFLTNNTFQSCPTPPATLGQSPSEPGTFDLDSVHASFVDFINRGGEGEGIDSWPPAALEGGPLGVSIPTASEELSASVMDPNRTAERGGTDANANADAHVSVPAQAQTPKTNSPDDETSAAKTIEDWLAEPSKIPTPAVSKAISYSSALQARKSLSHATADGTPILRDPHVVFLETHLGGVDFDLGPDSGLGLGVFEAEDIDTIHVAVDKMDWAIPNVATAATATAAAPHLASTPGPTSPSLPTNLSISGLGVVTPRPVDIPPSSTTPITLDELAQSVEEAVGSARARAKARAEAAAAAVAAAPTTTPSHSNELETGDAFTGMSPIEDTGAPTASSEKDGVESRMATGGVVGEGIGGPGAVEVGSPVRAGSELDFLEL